MRNKIAVIGAGAAGCCFACFSKHPVTLFEKKEPLKTLLATGGGRCNLAHAIYDFKTLAKNYPRGEKFLYSIFSRFSTQETLDFFKSIGVETYIQDDGRIFPVSNCSKAVRDAVLNNLKETRIIQEDVRSIKKISENIFLINKKYEFENVIISIGGHSNYDIIKQLGHNIIEPKPSLVGLICQEKFQLEGISLRNVKLKIKGKKEALRGDLIFTKNGISGPLAYIVSSLYARENYNIKNPIKLYIDFEIENLLINLDKNTKKTVNNFLSQYIPKRLSMYICKDLNIINKRWCELKKDERLKLIKNMSEFKITIISHEKTGEVVTSGGVDLDEINAKNMESKIVKGLYFCGEVIDVDGFCGGFNLQNAWSTSYIAAEDINKKYEKKMTGELNNA